MNILLLDDHAILMDGLEAVLKEETHLHIKAKMYDSKMALAHIRSDNINMVITDYAMPGIDGAAFTRIAKTIAPDLKIIVLGARNEPNIIRDVMESGADGFVQKKYAQQELLHAINTVITGRQYCSRLQERKL